MRLAFDRVSVCVYITMCIKTICACLSRTTGNRLLLLHHNNNNIICLPLIKRSFREATTHIGTLSCLVCGRVVTRVREPEAFSSLIIIFFFKDTCVYYIYIYMYILLSS